MFYFGLNEEEEKEAKRSSIGGWVALSSILFFMIACFGFSGGGIAVFFGLLGLGALITGLVLWFTNRSAEQIKKQKRDISYMHEMVMHGASPNQVTDDISGVTAAKQKAQQKEETKKIIKGAVVGDNVAGDIGAVVGATVAKNKIDSEKK